MATPTSITLLSTFIIIEADKEISDITPVQPGLMTGTVRQVWATSDRVDVGDIVAFLNGTAKYFSQGGSTFAVVDENDIILTTIAAAP